MEKKWEFDKEYLKNIINELTYILKHNKLPKQDKEILKTELFFFKKALKGHYWKNQMENIPSISFESLKMNVLAKMKRDYNILGDCSISKSIDEMIEDTLIIYNTYSKIFYEKAKFIYEHSCPLIQEVVHKKNTSFCVYSNHLQLPFLIIVKNEAPYILIHETQHCIENMLHRNSPFYFKELGPILFETINLDNLYPYQRNIAYYYKDRIEETFFHIDILQEYFKALLEFKERDFFVSSKEFIKIFEEIFYDNENLSMKEFVQNVQCDVLDPDYDLYICYFLSFLKSIELREQIYNDKKHGIELLENCLNNPSATFSFTNNTIDYYQRYCKEIYEKQKILIKK